MEIEITKKRKLLEVNNTMVHNYYYIYNSRVFNEDKTKFRKVRFILWFDIFDVMENIDAESVTKNDINQYAEEIGCSFIGMFLNVEKYIEECNETIIHFNKINR